MLLVSATRSQSLGLEEARLPLLGEVSVPCAQFVFASALLVVLASSRGLGSVSIGVRRSSTTSCAEQMRPSTACRQVWRQRTWLAQKPAGPYEAVVAVLVAVGMRREDQTAEADTAAGCSLHSDFRSLLSSLLFRHPRFLVPCRSCCHRGHGRPFLCHGHLLSLCRLLYRLLGRGLLRLVGCRSSAGCRSKLPSAVVEAVVET